jgi:hypothetical protein
MGMADHTIPVLYLERNNGFLNLMGVQPFIEMAKVGGSRSALLAVPGGNGWDPGGKLLGKMLASVVKGSGCKVDRVGDTGGGLVDLSWWRVHW